MKLLSSSFSGAFVLSALLGSLFIGCSGSHHEMTSSTKDASGLTELFGLFHKQSGKIPRDILQVTSLSGTPLANAQILIGSALDQPFKGNFLTTDSQGQFKAPADWTSEQAVTISAPGYVRTSFLNQIPDAQTFQVRLSPGAGRYEVKGQAQGFTIKNGDGLVDFALVMSPMNKQDFITVSIDKVVSSESDQISIIGKQVDIPSNVSLPNQKESYVLPITLNKPQYRIYFPEQGRQQLFGLKGQFPLKKVVDELQNNKQFYDVINYFTLQSGGIREADVREKGTTLDIPINELSFSQKTRFKAPGFANDEVLLALALSDYQSKLLPTDIKNVTANSSFELTTAPGSTPWLINALTKKDDKFGQISAFLLPFYRDVAPQMLALMNPPQQISASQLKLTPVAALPELTKRATYLALSNITKERIDNIEIEKIDRLWEVYGGEWLSDVQIPQWPNDSVPSGKKRWEATLIGGPDMRSSITGAAMLDTATHATHSQVDSQ